jgi:hypothetical protein
MTLMATLDFYIFPQNKDLMDRAFWVRRDGSPEAPEPSELRNPDGFHLNLS